MEEVYKITFKNRILHFWLIYIYLFGMICFVVFMIFKEGIEDLQLYITFAFFGFLVLFVPTLYLHISYLVVNYRCEMTLDYESNIIVFSNKREVITFSFDDIEVILQYKTFALARNAPGWLPWEVYHYDKVKLKSGKEIIITCLMTSNLDWPIHANKIHLHKIFFPYLKK